MRSFRKHLLALAVVLMLTGCSDNNSSTEPEITSSPEVTGITVETEETAELTETDQTSKSTGNTGTPEQSDPPVETSPEGEAPQNTGVSLVSGEYSDNTLKFNLNGRYCEFSELPISIQTYQPDLPEGQEFIISDIRNGKMILLQNIPDAEVQPADGRFFLPVRLYTYDLQTGTLTQIFSSLEPFTESEGAITDRPNYVDDKYIAVYQDKGGEEFMTVFSLEERRAVLSLPVNTENCSYFYSGLVCIVDDYLYFDGEYMLPEYEKTVLAAFRASLQDGRVELISAGIWGPQYGVGNVCFQVAKMKGGFTDLRGNNFLSETSTGVQTVIWDTYYPIEIEPLKSKILGERYHVRWKDKYHIYQDIGTTGFGYKPYYYNAQITKDGIFLIELLHEESGGENNRILIGVYDPQTGENTAALIEPSEPRAVIADNTAIYIVNTETLETTVLTKNSESY